MLLKATVLASEIPQPNISGTCRVKRYYEAKLKGNNLSRKIALEEKKVYLLISVSVRSHVSNFHISFSFSGLSYPSFMRGFIQENIIPANGRSNQKQVTQRVYFKGYWSSGVRADHIKIM